MSVEYHDNWKKGETWTVDVTLTGSDGSPITNPSAVTWTLTDWAGAALTKSLGSGITVNGNVATITVPTSDQAALKARLHKHKLIVADSGGAISMQMHGTIGVLP